MNISCHSFCCTEYHKTTTGNFIASWNPFFNLGFHLRLFPYDGGRYSLQRYPGASLISVYTNSFYAVPYYINDVTNPKQFPLILY